MLVLCGAGLLLRTLLAIDSADQGYRAEGERVLTLDFVLPANQYATADSRRQFYDGVEREVEAVPGVRGAGWATRCRLAGRSSAVSRSRSSEIRRHVTATSRRRTFRSSTTYFRTLDLPIVAGRAFTLRTAPTPLPVCIVSEGFVRRTSRAESARDPASGEHEP